MGRYNGENESEDLPYRSLKRLSWSRAKDKVDAQCINQGMACSLLIIEPFDESQAAFFVGKYFLCGQIYKLNYNKHEKEILFIRDIGSADPYPAWGTC